MMSTTVQKPATTPIPVQLSEPEFTAFTTLSVQSYMMHPHEGLPMTLVRVKRSAQITLPADLRKLFHLEEGGYLEAEAVAEGILLKPVAVLDRHQARQQLQELLDRVHAKLPASDKSPQGQEEDITRIIKELRQDDAATRRA
jgi:AbrB family looped-hinge helix DNA binding protein